ncbi:HK97 gp10 family phage protein [Ensifer sp. ENS10]|uniref:HK97 gp10 family phage protein n=1 Tax=Ensifer sp. ENS10 TaxID=2769286 RepID=UPI00178137B1|nr:HK97 gp10 family phage protein [Ensifer sp. ENS10]MBD9511631.1 HK97 gp10 family phage protein [Ensifer sp. ENS10]
MKSKLKVTGLAAVRTELRSYGDRVPDAARKTMHRSAEIIRDMAREYAPEDEGNLVRGIKIIKDYGANGRLQIDIGIEMPADAFSKSGTPLTAASFDRYATLVHENYESEVAYVNGPSRATIAKMARHGEKVGSFFLRTAAEEEEKKLDDKMVNAITQVINEVGG